MYLRDDSEKVLDRNIGDRVDALLDDSDELLIILGGHLSIRKGMVRGMMTSNLHFMGNALIGLSRNPPQQVLHIFDISCIDTGGTSSSNFVKCPCTNLKKLKSHRLTRAKSSLQSCETFRYSFQKSKPVLRIKGKWCMNEAFVYHIPW